MKTIESPSNPLVKQWLLTTTNQGLKKSEQAMVCGEKIIKEFSIVQDTIVSILHTNQDSLEELCATLNVSDKKAVVVAKDIFKQLDVLNTGHPLLIVKKPVLQAYVTNSFQKGLCVFAGLSDPGNLGALIRSCEAFSVKQLVLLQESCNPFTPKVTKAAAGANYRLPLLQSQSIKNLEEDNLTVLHMEGEDIAKIGASESIKLLIGEEGLGVQDFKYKQKRIRIPMSGAIESLNATVASSIALYEFNKSLNL